MLFIGQNQLGLSYIIGIMNMYCKWNPTVLDGKIWKQSKLKGAGSHQS